MTPLQTLEIRAGDIRGRLSEIAELELTDETRAELGSLRREYQDNEAKQAALKIAGVGPEPPKETATETREEKERNELRASVQFGTYVAAAIGGHPVFNGPEAEYNRKLAYRVINSRLNCWAVALKSGRLQPMVTLKRIRERGLTGCLRKRLQCGWVSQCVAYRRA